MRALSPSLLIFLFFFFFRFCYFGCVFDQFVQFTHVFVCGDVAFVCIIDDGIHCWPEGNDFWNFRHDD
jgi:hypothetical protein